MGGWHAFQVALDGTPLGFDGRNIQHPTDSQVIRELVIGRRLLVKATGQDFGFGLEPWLCFLQSNPEWGCAEQLNNPDVREHLLMPSIAHQKSVEFRRFCEQAEIGWNTGLFADVSLEFLKERRREKQREIERRQELFWSLSEEQRMTLFKASHQAEVREPVLSPQALCGGLGFASLVFFIYGLFCSATDGYERLGAILLAAGGLCFGASWWVMEKETKRKERLKAAVRYVSDDCVY